MSSSIPSTLLAPSRVSVRTRDRPSSERAVLLTGACICVPATLCVLLAIFAGTLAAAIVTWRHYTMLRDHDRWLLRACRVVSVGVSADDSPSLHALETHTYFRAEANVTTADIKGVVLAFWGRDGSFTLSADQATVRAHGVTAKAKVSCWSRRRTPSQISMIAVPRQRAPAEDLYLNMAWGSSFFATISGALVAAIGANFVQRGLFGVAATANTAAHGVINPLKHPVCLTSAQAKYVMLRFGEMEGAAADQWACSICLEDDERGAVVRKVTLPCKHRYHGRCLRKWLRRGAPTCPLCNFNVQTLFHADGTPIEEKGEAESEAALEERCTVAVVELDDIALPHPVMAVRPSTVSTARPP